MMFGKRQKRVSSAQKDSLRAAFPKVESRLRLRSIKSLLRSESGGMAIIYALCLVPLLAFAGLALDYSRGSLGQSRLQSALDAAGLSVARLPADTRTEEIEQKALEWMKASLADKGLDDIELTARKIGANAERIRLEAHSKVDMTLSRVIRTEPFKISAATEIALGKDTFEIVLVLDNSGSMVQDPDGNPEPDPTKWKLTRLKEAATSFINYLDERVPDKDQLKVSVVPFSGVVKVGKEYKNAPWMDLTGSSPINKEIFIGGNPSRFDLFTKMGVQWAGCVESRPMKVGSITVDYDVSETPPNPYYPETLFVPYFEPDTPDGDFISDYLLKHNLEELDSDHDYLPDQTTSDDWDDHVKNVTKYVDIGKHWETWGPNAGCRMAPILRLTSKMKDVRKRLEEMVDAGSTNINMGLMWGWHSLSPSPPFADGKPYFTRNLHKIVILMTDGQNSYEKVASPDETHYIGYGYWKSGRIGGKAGETSPTRTNIMNQRLALLCTEMKKKGIQLYTMRVEFGTGVDPLLQGCATSPDMYYNVDDSAKLEEVFKDIGKKIAQLRIAK